MDEEEEVPEEEETVWPDMDSAESFPEDSSEAFTVVEGYSVSRTSEEVAELKAEELAALLG